MKKRFYAVVLSMLMIVSVFAGISLADEEPSANEKTLFTLHRVDGATQYEVTAGGEQRVIYCMEYDHLWPTTEDGGYENTPIAGDLTQHFIWSLMAGWNVPVTGDQTGLGLWLSIVQTEILSFHGEICPL